MIVRGDWIQELYLKSIIKGETHEKPSRQSEESNKTGGERASRTASDLPTQQSEIKNGR